MIIRKLNEARVSKVGMRSGARAPPALYKFDELSEDREFEFQLDRINNDLQPLFPSKVVLIFDNKEGDIHGDYHDIDAEKLPHELSFVSNGGPENVKCPP